MSVLERYQLLISEDVAPVTLELSGGVEIRAALTHLGECAGVVFPQVAGHLVPDTIRVRRPRRPPCGICNGCGAGPFAIVAEPEPEKAWCGLCRGPIEIRPEIRYESRMPSASPPLIEPGSPGWEAIEELRASM
jgi:hypothetical protein